jgi:hypothetical protein
MFLVILGISSLHKNSTFFGSFLSVLQVVYAKESFGIDTDKVDSGIQNENRASDLLDEMDEKSKPNQNHNEGQTNGEDFNNLGLTFKKLRDNNDDFKKENFAIRDHDRNNNKDSQAALPTKENKIHEPVQFCGSSSGRSDIILCSCYANEYCKSVSYSKDIKCTRISSHISNNPSRADAGPDQVVPSGHIVILNDKEKLHTYSVGRDDRYDDFGFSWAQLFPRQPVIKLSDKHVVSPTFVAPIMSHDTVFVFQLTTKKNHFEEKDTVRVVVTKSYETSLHTAYSPNKPQTTSSNSKHETRIEHIYEEKPSTGIVIDQEKTSDVAKKHNVSYWRIISKDNLDEVENEHYNSKNDDNISMSCSADRIIIVKSTKGFITCNIHNDNSFPIELQLKCSGLEATEVQCFINRYYKSGSIIVEGKSSKTFPVVAITPFVHSGEMRLYPFTISAN